MRRRATLRHSLLLHDSLYNDDPLREDPLRERILYDDSRRGAISRQMPLVSCLKKRRGTTSRQIPRQNETGGNLTSEERRGATSRQNSGVYVPVDPRDDESTGNTPTPYHTDGYDNENEEDKDCAYAGVILPALQVA